MEPRDRLTQAMVLGEMMDEESRKQIGQINKDDLKEVLTSVDAARICVKKAIDELDKVPGTSDWMLRFTLSMIDVQLYGTLQQLENRR